LIIEIIMKYLKTYNNIVKYLENKPFIEQLKIFIFEACSTYVLNIKHGTMNSSDYLIFCQNFKKYLNSTNIDLLFEMYLIILYHFWNFYN
jgi:hypothetical protein